MSTDDDTGAGLKLPAPDPQLRKIPTPDDRGWIDLRQFATLMEKSYHTILKWKREGRFKSVQVGGQYRIYEDEIRYIMEHGTRNPETGVAEGIKL